MGDFSLTRADIRRATGWKYARIRTLIQTPYRLESRHDPAGPKGGGRTERFRLGDVLARCRDKRAFNEVAMTPELIAIDAAYRKENNR